MEISSHYLTHSKKLSIPYPEELENKCILCDREVKRKYNTSERSIYRLDGIYHVRYDLVTCTNPECHLFDVPFNPAPRFAYSQRRYGRDVLELIGEYSINSSSRFNAQQITTILENQYNLPISSRTVARMCDDILILTSFQIDDNTNRILSQQKKMLIALDGQEPDNERPALWNFTDIISGRVLMTKFLESSDHLILHRCLQELQDLYPYEIIGFLSDKQGSIRKCIETFYPEIPHQYCTFHFSANLWKHLEKFGNKIHTILQKTVKKLNICTVSANSKIEVPNSDEKVSLKELCAPLAKELKKVVKSKNVKFEQLRGVEEYEKLSNYMKGFRDSVANILVNDRFANLMRKTIHDLDDGMKKTHDIYLKSLEGLELFLRIHKILWKDELDREVKINAADAVFKDIWNRTIELNPRFSKSDRKSFLPSSKTPFWMLLAEWTRLWESYLPGLFRYYEFDVKIKSNVDMEQKFSVQKQIFRSQCGKGQVGQMVMARGQYILRLLYCSMEEINLSEIIGNSSAHLQYLRDILNSNIGESAAYNSNYEISNKIYTELLKRMYMPDTTKMEG